VSVAEAKVVETLRGREGRSSPSVKAAPRPAPKPEAEPKKDEGAATHVVKSGETLRKIAVENQYEGVSLEQMLVGLYQTNPDAFIGKNINRLKAGAILGVPEKSAVEAVSEAEAKKVYVAHANDWNAYRQKLAANAAKAQVRDESGAQATSGKITAKVEDKAIPVDQAKDQLKISRTELAAKSSASKAAAASEVDQIAKDKALKDAQGRLASLEKNVDELQKLLELKNKKLAELQQPAAKKEEVKPVEPPKPVEVAKPVEPVKPVEAAKPAEPVKEAEPAAVPEPVKPVEVAKPVEEKPVEAAKPVEPAPVPPPATEVEEPGFLDSLLGSPLTLLGGGGVLALLAGFFLARRRRQEKAPSQETTAAPSPSSLGPNSVFRMTGGQSIDTANAAPQTGDFSQTGPGSIDTDEVDPVAEADVYMAYGRDTQAEEILLEALQKDPQRTAIHAKLLEIYANRKSVKQFETLASELYAQTGGVGPEWEKVSELGAGLDPQNPLYSGAQSAAVSPFDAGATIPVSLSDELALPDAALSSPEPAEIDALPVFASGDLDISEPVELQPVAVALGEEPEEELTSFDFDIDVPAAESASKPVEESIEAPKSFDEPYIDTVVTGESNALDFDLGAAEQPAEIAPEATAESPVVEDLASEIVDFDLGAEQSGSEEVVAPVALDASPDFSPEGTMVMPSGMDDDLAAVSTYVGVDGSSGAFAAEPAEVPPEEELPTMGDLDFAIDAPAPEAAVNSSAQAVSSITPEIEIDNPQLAATVVAPDADSLEFDVKLTDSVFLGQPMMPTDFDIGSINLDLAAEPSPQPVASAPASASEVAEADVVDDITKDAHWEQVNTKLDLAKAYEEMGDLEGARELLQEVLGEGSTDLVEQAHTILGRIGE